MYVKRGERESDESVGWDESDGPDLAYLCHALGVMRAAARAGLCVSGRYVATNGTNSTKGKGGVEARQGIGGG